MNDLPIEIITHHILPHIDKKNIINNIQLVSKTFYKACMMYFSLLYKDDIDEDFLKISKNTSMFIEQIQALKKIKQIRTEKEKEKEKEIETEFVTSVIHYVSPLGTGKTAISLYLALCSKYKTIIILTSRILSSWMDELKKFGIYDKDPEKSVVLFFHSEMSKEHMKYIKKNGYENSINNHNIIVCTRYYFSNLLIKIKKNTILNIMIDESHLTRACFYLNEYFVNEILFISSLSNNNNSFCNVNKFKKYIVKCYHFNLNKDLIKDRMIIPKIGGKYASLHYEYIDISDVVIPIDKNSLLDNEIIKIFLSFDNTKYNKIIVFSNIKYELLKQIKTKLETFIDDYYILCFNNKSDKHMNIFRTTNKIIVLCNYLMTAEGINFSEADCAIYSNYEYNTPEKAQQVLGRIKRKNNTYDDIDIYFIKSIDHLEYVKTRINQIYVFNDNINNLITRMSNDVISSKIIFLQKRGYYINKLTDIEIMLLFTNYYTGFKNIDLLQNINIQLNDFIMAMYINNI